MNLDSLVLLAVRPPHEISYRMNVPTAIAIQFEQYRFLLCPHELNIRASHTSCQLCVRVTKQMVVQANIELTHYFLCECTQ